MKKISSAWNRVFLSKLDAYTLHKEIKKQKKRNPYLERYHFKINLVEISKLKVYNDNVGYLFNCINVFTKFAWSVSIQRKTSDETLFKLLSWWRSSAITNGEGKLTDGGTCRNNQRLNTTSLLNRITLVSSVW